MRTRQKRGPLTSSATILRVRGIPLGAHWSWLFVFALVVWSLSAFLFPSTYPGLADSTYIVMGLVAGILFFASILLHELGHAFRALTEGMRIDGITLWLFGGVARFRGMFPSAGAEFRIAVAGPVVSAVIAAAFGAVTVIGSAAGFPDALQGVVDYLWRINGLVLAFNLVPALPLDGGRILRAWLWHRQQSFSAATRSAAIAGQAFGWVLITVGILNFLAGGAGASGFWFALLGWFLIQAARAEASAILLRQAIGGRPVRDYMTPDPVVVPPDMSIDAFLDHVVGVRGHPAYPVIKEGELVGLVSLEAACRIPEEARARARLQEVALSKHELGLLEPDTDMSEALEALQSEPQRALVTENGRLAGILSISDVNRALEVEQARGPRQEPRARRAGLLVWAIVTLTMALVAGFLYRPALVVVQPGPTLDVSQDIRISGVPAERPNGTYLLTSVRLDRPTALGTLFAWAFSDREVLALSEVVPEGQDRDDFFRQQVELFRQSRVIAAGAAAREAGMNVAVRGTGAVIQDVLRSSPAAEVLQPGDVVTRVNGEKVDIATDLQSAIRARPAGTRFRLTIERDAAERLVEVRSTRLSRMAEGNVGIGAFLSTRDFDVRLPFDIDFKNRQIGGPSAGLVYALAIFDMIEPGDSAGGNKIAATGTIDVDGSVGLVGGVDAKAESVEDARAGVFFVPAQEVDEVSIEGLDVRGVSSLDEALRALGATTRE